MVTTMLELVKEAVTHDLPIYVQGRSGWGKTAIVDRVGEILELEVVKLSLALTLPEDIGGIPAPDGASFRHLLPDWFHSRINKNFILFLDEINQAPPQTLHAIYSLVQERRLHSHINRGMRIVAAGNLTEENPHLTNMMQPLLNRFYVVDFIHDHAEAVKFLNAKYSCNLTELENSPRDTEQGILALQAGLKELAIKKAGLSVVNQLEKNGAVQSEADSLILDSRFKRVVDENGFVKSIRNSLKKP